MSPAPRKSSVADWRPSARVDVLRARALLFGRIRAFFDAAGVLEVETPILSHATTTDPALASLMTRVSLGNESRALYLHTSPELAMKRLLAAGSGPIYQIARVFRDGERGRYHHPEFTMLEWYRPGWHYRQLMDEVANLVRTALGRSDLAVERIAYRDLFHERLGLDPWDASARDLAQVAAEQGIGGAEALTLNRDGWLDLLLSHCLEPGLGRNQLTFVYDYPPSQAALARRREGPTTVAERFELYLDGLELANGFQELTDAAEQRGRFERDLRARAAAGQPVPPIDQAFLAALAAGLPEASGVALGLERLLMRGLGLSHIDQVLSFPIERA